MFERHDVENYFLSYKHEQMMMIVIGGIAILSAIFFYAALKSQWYRGFSLPLAVFGLLFFGAGFGNLKKTDDLRVRNVYNYDMHPEQLKLKELPRVQQAGKDLEVLIIVNACMVAASFFIFLYFRKRESNGYYMGMSSSLFLVAALSIAFYILMLQPLKLYRVGIEKYTATIIINKS